MKFAIISDIHGNFPALERVLNKIDNIGVDQVISLGDITGYYSEPDRCINELRKRNVIQLLGNHDKYLIDNSGCPRSKLISDLLIYQYKDVSNKNINYLKTLKSRYDFKNLTFVHGGWKDNLDEYMFNISYKKLIGDYKFYFSGHTHVQVKFNIDDKQYCNPGSVGQPRDGDPRAAFCVYENNQIELYRVEYDINETVLAMKKAGYKNPRLWENLYIGAQIGGRIDKERVNITPK